MARRRPSVVGRFGHLRCRWPGMLHCQHLQPARPAPWPNPPPSLGSNRKRKEKKKKRKENKTKEKAQYNPSLGYFSSFSFTSLTHRGCTPSSPTGAYSSPCHFQRALTPPRVAPLPSRLFSLTSMGEYANQYTGLGPLPGVELETCLPLHPHLAHTSNHTPTHHPHPPHLPDTPPKVPRP